MIKSVLLIMQPQILLLISVHISILICLLANLNSFRYPCHDTKLFLLIISKPQILNLI